MRATVRSVLFLSSLLVLVCLVGACAGTQVRTERAENRREVVEMEPLRITATTGEDGRFTLEAYDAQDLFGHGTQAFQTKRCPAAVETYDRLVSEFPESSLVAPSLFNAGLCLQATADFEGAAERYERLRALRPDSDDFLFATLRLAEMRVQLNEFKKAMVLAEALLARSDLSSYERLEAMARRSQALLGVGQLEEAEAYAKSALTYFRTRSDKDAIHDEFYAAANGFVIAETYRLRAENIPFPKGLEPQKKVLLRRAELVLEAQRQYSNTISFVHLDNYHWMTASGYRLGQMYDELWRAVMAAPVPAHLEADGADIYRHELAKLIKPLIRHAIRYWEMTLLLVERTGIQNSWTKKIRQDLERVRKLMLEQPKGQGGLPPSTAIPETVPKQVAPASNPAAASKEDAARAIPTRTDARPGNSSPATSE